jgi:hypothetical protein
MGASLSSCSIAVKAIYNQFSDEEEFVLFQGERKSKNVDLNLENEDRKVVTEKIESDTVEIKMKKADNKPKDGDFCMELNSWTSQQNSK